MTTELAEAAQAVPAPEVTTTPEAVVAPEVSADTAPPTPEKTFTQAELDAIVAKRVAREARKLQRQQAPAPAVTPVVPPKVEDFNDAPAYAEALAESKAAELVNKREAEKQAAEVRASYDEREESARDKYDDFEQVAYNPAVPITEYMAQTLMQSDAGPDILYHLGSNPKEAQRIAGLSPLIQAREIGKLEAKLAAAPPVKTTSSAPAPITPVKPAAGAAKSYDTTDPRSVKDMTTSQWIEAERDRQRKAIEAKRNR